MKQEPLLPGGTVHELTSDLEVALRSDEKFVKIWLDLTPLARNEWICWTTNAKQEATNNRRIKRTLEELSEGNRRPCCWIGCIHRTDKAISPSVKGILSGKKKN
jgi:hypothetical protein